LLRHAVVLAFDDPPERTDGFLMKQPVDGLSASATDRLLGYSWPGNVRELANVMERGVAVAQGKRVNLEDLPPEVRSLALPPVTSAGARPLKEMEKDYILAILEANGGNRTQTALTLRIGKATLQRKLKSFKSNQAKHPSFGPE
jgi:DNA-binding NtrC family response regulator